MGPRSDTPTSCSAAGKTCRRGAACARSGGPPVLAPIVTGDAYRYSPVRLRRGTRTTRAIGVTTRAASAVGARHGRPHRAEARPRRHVFLRAEHDVGWAAQGPHRTPPPPYAARTRETFRRLQRRPSRWGLARTPPLRTQRPERRVDGGRLRAKRGTPILASIVTRDGYQYSPVRLRRGTRATSAMMRSGHRSPRSLPGGQRWGAARPPDLRRLLRRPHEGATRLITEATTRSHRGR